MAEQSEPLERERVCEQVDVAGEDVERERGGVDPLAAALAALVDVEDAELLRERIEPRPQVRVVKSRPAVKDDQREAVAGKILYEERVPVVELDVQLLASCQSSPTPMSTASGGSRS